MNYIQSYSFNLTKCNKKFNDIFLRHKEIEMSFCKITGLNLIFLLTNKKFNQCVHSYSMCAFFYHGNTKSK